MRQSRFSGFLVWQVDMTFQASERARKRPSRAFFAPARLRSQVTGREPGTPCSSFQTLERMGRCEVKGVSGEMVSVGGRLGPREADKLDRKLTISPLTISQGSDPQGLTPLT